MKIAGIRSMGVDELKDEIDRGGKFVIFQYCISVLILTFTRSSDVCFIRADESTLVKGLPYTMMSLVLGWWGFPWGPIFTVTTVVTNLGGGKNVTKEIIQILNAEHESDDNEE